MKVNCTDPALPCGCRPIHNTVILGVDAEEVHGVTAADPQLGLLWLYRHVLEPDLIERDARGIVVKRKGLDVVQVAAPFEMHCRNHPADSATWREYQARRALSSWCPKHEIPIGGPGEACPVCVERTAGPERTS